MYFYQLDFKNNITALASSILEHYHCPHTNDTLAKADMILKNAPRNVVLILLDGLGYSVLTKHLDENSFLRSHLKGTLCSVFPPTTAAAATALETGLFPAQSGYLGWSVYWPRLRQNVQLYPNTLDDGTKAAQVHLAQTELYAPIWTKEIRTRWGVPAYSVMENGDIEARSLEEIEEKIIMLTTLDGPHLIYAYLNQPDHLLHREGTASVNVAAWLEKADHAFYNLAQCCPDTLFLMTADHGFTDIESLCMEDYPELKEMLRYAPSVEPRAMNLFVKKGMEKEFCSSFYNITKGTYHLYSRQEVLRMMLFGPKPYHPFFEEMLGDYLAVAQTPLTLFPTRSYMESMVAAHGGMTPQELTAPFLVWQGTKK